MPSLFAAPPASTARPVVSPICSLIAFNNRRLFSSTLPSKHPTPPRPGACALLSPYRSGGGLAPALLLLGRLLSFLLPATSVQLSAQVVALAFGLFASPALLGHAVVQRRLRHLATGPLGVELILGLSRCGVGLDPILRLLDRLGCVCGLLWGFQLRRDSLERRG